MNYVLLFVETEQFNSDMADMSPSERERAYDRVNEWFANHSDKLRGGSKLKSSDTATTVRLDRGEPVIIDGPFVEGKEIVSGYVEIRWSHRRFGAPPEAKVHLETPHAQVPGYFALD